MFGSGINSKQAQCFRSLGRQIMGKGIITLNASQLRIVLATFKCNLTTSDFLRRLQCLVSPTALSTGRRESDWEGRFAEEQRAAKKAMRDDVSYKARSSDADLE